MEQRIGVSKAARYLGIKRSELIKRLAAAKIETFEGEVDFEKIKCIAPQFEQIDPHLSRLDKIREKTFFYDGDKIQGSAEELQNRIKRLTVDAAIDAEVARDYLKIIEDVAAKLGTLQASDNEERRKIGFELCEWLRNKVNTHKAEHSNQN